MPYFGLLTNGVNRVVSCPVKHNIDGICVLSSIFLPTAGNWSALTAPPAGRNLHVHFLIHWGDGDDRGEEHWDKGASALGAGEGVKG